MRIGILGLALGLVTLAAGCQSSLAENNLVKPIVENSRMIVEDKESFFATNDDRAANRKAMPPSSW